MPSQDRKLTTRRPAAAARMRHLRKAQLAGTDEHGLTLDCGSGTTCHLVAVSDEVVRVLFLQGSAPREPKSWMVLGAPPAVINCTERSAAPTQQKCGPHLHHSQPDAETRIVAGYAKTAALQPAAAACRPPPAKRTGETGGVTDIAVQATAAQGDGASATQPRAMPWEGRDRLDLRGYRKVKLDIRVLAGTVELRTAALTVEARPAADNPPTCYT